MQPRPTPTGGRLLSCEICLTEIPLSAAKSFEADDYVHYFCGAECFDQWRRQAETAADSKKGSISK